MKRTLNTKINGVTLEEVLHYKRWPRVALYKATDEQLLQVVQEILEEREEDEVQSYLDHWDYQMAGLND